MGCNPTIAQSIRDESATVRNSDLSGQLRGQMYANARGVFHHARTDLDHVDG